MAGFPGRLLERRPPGSRRLALEKLGAGRELATVSPTREGFSRVFPNSGQAPSLSPRAAGNEEISGDPHGVAGSHSPAPAPSQLSPQLLPGRVLRLRLGPRRGQGPPTAPRGPAPGRARPAALLAGLPACRLRTLV